MLDAGTVLTYRVGVLFMNRLGDSLAVELSTLTRAAKVRILVPQPVMCEGGSYGPHETC